MLEWKQRVNCRATLDPVSTSEEASVTSSKGERKRGPSGLAMGFDTGICAFGVDDGTCGVSVEPSSLGASSLSLDSKGSSSLPGRLAAAPSVAQGSIVAEVAGAGEPARERGICPTGPCWRCLRIGSHGIHWRNRSSGRIRVCAEVLLVGESMIDGWKDSALPVSGVGEGLLVLIGRFLMVFQSKISVDVASAPVVPGMAQERCARTFHG